MDQLNEYSKEVVDRFLKSMGYDPNHIDRDKRMAFTKTIRFQQFAQRMGDSAEVREDVKEQVTFVPRPLSKSAQLIKSIYSEHRAVREELYDSEKDDKDGGTYGKKPKMKVNPQEDNTAGDKKTQAAAVLSGGTTLTGQNRDSVEIDPVLKKSKPGSPNGDVGNTKQ